MENYNQLQNSEKRARGLKVVNRIFSIAKEKVTDPLLRKNVGTFLVKKLLYKEYL